MYTDLAKAFRVAGRDQADFRAFCAGPRASLFAISGVRTWNEIIFFERLAAGN